jgi:CheY-like chemotaxis protein
MTLENKRIFYVEDDQLNRTIVQTVLEGQKVTFAFDKWAFVETLIPKIKAFKPDLILLDLMLPLNISGYDVYTTLRGTPYFASTPIVAVSAADPSIEMPRCRKEGFNGFIAKPIDVMNFPQQLIKVLEGEKVWAVTSCHEVKTSRSILTFRQASPFVNSGNVRAGC